jgi:hypothetical protein
VGVAKAPLETALAARQRAAGLGTADISSPKVQERLGQLGYLAALGGYRAALADILWIKAYTAWSDTNWGDVKLLCEAVVTLQPRCVLFWQMYAWHMAYNAGYAAEYDESQPNAAIRELNKVQYWKLGEEILLRGIRNNPDRAKLYEDLATIYRDKFKDHALASKYYSLAADRPDSLGYNRRFAAYELAKIDGRELDGFRELLRLHDLDPVERTPTLYILLQQLSRKLEIPIPPHVMIPEKHKLR